MFVGALCRQSYRNTVPVPRHWCQKRKYLQGKRGIEKTPFELPEFIAMTGIDKIRAAVEEADNLKKVRRGTPLAPVPSG